MTVPFDVAEDGRYEIVAQLAHSPDYGAYTVELDGQATAKATALEHEPGANVGEAGRIDAYFTETYVAEDHLIGWAQLAGGRHTLTFVCAGRNAAASAYNLGIDTIILAKLGTTAPQDPAAQPATPTLLRAIGERGAATAPETAMLVTALKDPSDEVREAAAWSLGQLPSLDATAPLIAALDNHDHVVRGLAALALRQRGTRAAPARDALLARLGDSEVGVRMMAAQAIGRLKDSSTIDALVAACKVPDQQVHVLRSLADALGAMGPAASTALPTLRGPDEDATCRVGRESGDSEDQWPTMTPGPHRRGGFVRSLSSRCSGTCWGASPILADVTMKPEDIAKLTEAQQALMASRPAWSIAGTAVAVWFGAAGCIGLILRKQWATWVLIASLAGVVLQDLWLFVLSHALSGAGAVGIMLQGIVLIVSIGLVYLARVGSARGWLR